MKKVFLLISLFVFSQCTSDKSTKSADINSLNSFYAKIYEGEVMRSPETQTALGRKTNYGLWDDYSKAHHDLELNFTKNILKTLQDSFPLESIPESERLNYKLFTKKYENKLKNASYFNYKFWVNQMHGIQAEIPAFLINKHKIKSAQDARDYIQRVKGINAILENVELHLEESAQKGIIVPQFVFEHVINDCQNIISGSPLTNGKPNTIFADFQGKLDALKLTKPAHDALNKAFVVELKSMSDAYTHFINYLEKLKAKAPIKDGLWQYPDGQNYYQHQLAKHTTTDYTAEEIHQIGLSEVERIHNEMKKIKDEVGFKGDLPAFFKYMKEEDKFYYPATPQGKKDYIVQAENIIAGINKKLTEMFNVFPKAALLVKPVEAFREKSAGKAFYEEPAIDGSRPGTFYVNTYNMKAIPIYQLEALAYHEGNPGHHMQIAIALENDQLPEFRKNGTNYTAYDEGWALYSESFPKDYGFYQDPYSNFGRLAMELWRACRLVVDTGIHYKKWDREKGTKYYSDNTPNDIGDCVKMVERHIVMPGQATSYKMGMLKIIALRTKAQKALGDKFKIGDFHDQVLASGTVPLDILEEIIDGWIEKTRS